MRHIAFALALSLSALPALAQELHRTVAQVALLPLSEGPHDDIEALLRTHWKPFYGSAVEHGFTMKQVRAGRIDLDNDGQAELFLMIDAPNWEAAHGKPFVAARWTAKGWSAAGWGWGDEDGIFLTAERLSGWLSIDTKDHWMRWNGKVYQLVEKPSP